MSEQLLSNSIERTIAELEAENARLRQQLAEAQGWQPVEDGVWQHEPFIVFCGDDNFERQAGSKICLDYSKRIVRMSLVLRPERQTSTRRIVSERSGLTKPKDERRVVHLPFDSYLLEWPKEISE